MNTLGEAGDVILSLQRLFLGEVTLVSVSAFALCARMRKKSVTNLILWISKLPSTILVGLLGISVTEIITAMVVFRAIMHCKPLIF